MDEIRREQLWESWNHENDDPESEDWRLDLTPEELEYVEQLDDSYTNGIRQLCTAILVRERIRDRYSPAEILSLETVGDHCRLWLRDGTAYLARLAGDGTLRLDELDPAC